MQVSRRECLSTLAALAAAPAGLAIGAPAIAQATRDPMDGLPFVEVPWPGRMSRENRALIEPLMRQMVEAMNARDRDALRSIRARLIKGMGKYLGQPEDRPRYGVPVDTTTPDVAVVQRLWSAQQERRAGRMPWEEAVRITRAGGTPPRLRVSTRIARADLQMFEAEALGTRPALDRARAAADYMLSVQHSSGVFGYPYDPKGTNGAARWVRGAEERGKHVAEGGWWIEDLDTGGLNFDNAGTGLFLLHVYALTGEDRYLQAARRAGDWAAGRRLVSNFNYNGFNGQLLSRLYRITGKESYLDRARGIFEFGVLSGQLENGRWLDQHNAKIQYHAIMMSQLGEFLLALRLAKNAFQATVERAMVLGLDNLAKEITTRGSSNIEEMLAVDALVIGSLVLGNRQLWTDALNANVNFYTRHEPALTARGIAVPEPLALYVLFRRGYGQEASRIDSEPTPRVAPATRS